MLELAGACADGVAIWLGGPRFVENFALPRIDAGAKSAGKQRPRVIVGLPVCVTQDPSARNSAVRYFGPSSRLPAYRRVLDREGATGPDEVAIIGDEEHVLRRLERIARLGVSDFNAILFSVKSDPGATQRTRDVLGAYSRGVI